jgi:hypothetical protein
MSHIQDTIEEAKLTAQQEAKENHYTIKELEQKKRRKLCICIQHRI